MTQPPIDPAADSSRRAWLQCPNCRRGRDCADCGSSRNCQIHWQYLLSNAGHRVRLQCPACAHRWTVETLRAPKRRRPVVATIPVEHLIRHLVDNPTRRHLYATTHDSVLVIDRCHRVVAEVPVDVDPRAMIVSTDGSLAYVTGYDGSVSILDTARLTARTVAADPATATVLDPHDNYLYQAHSEAGNCWISAMTDDGVTATVLPVDSHATALAASPTGGRLYVGSSRPLSRNRHGRGSVSIIDTETFAVLEVIPTDLPPDTVAVSPDGSTLYLTHYHADAITVLQIESRTQTLIRLGDAPLDVTVNPAGDRLLVTGLQSLSLLDTATHAVTPVPTGDLPRHVRIGADGTLAYLTDARHNSLWLLDAARAAVITTVALDTSPTAVALTAEEPFLYLAGATSAVLTVISPALLCGSPAQPDEDQAPRR